MPVVKAKLDLEGTARWKALRDRPCIIVHRMTRPKGRGPVAEGGGWMQMAALCRSPVVALDT